jgi:hypothetical protein
MTSIAKRPGDVHGEGRTQALRKASIMNPAAAPVASPAPTASLHRFDAYRLALAFRTHVVLWLPVKRAELSGMEKDYQIIYRDLSAYLHANDLKGHVNIDANRGLGLRLGTSDKPEVRKVLDTARRILASTMYRVSATMDLGYLAEISRLMPSGDDTVHALPKAWKRRFRHPRRWTVSPAVSGSRCRCRWNTQMLQELVGRHGSGRILPSAKAEQHLHDSR